MSIPKKIEIQNFKGIFEAQEEFSDMPKFIGGENGKGKTSLLEAIRYGLTGKTPSREDILTEGQDSGYVLITFNDPDETCIVREFFKEKPTKVSVNGRGNTAKAAQELINSLMDTNDDYLNLNTSNEVFRELLKGELGKFLLSFIPEQINPTKFFELVEFTTKEKDVLNENLPEMFGLSECQTLYSGFYEKRAATKAAAQRLAARISGTIPEKPTRTIEAVENELSKILAAQQVENTYKAAVRSYENTLRDYNVREAEIKKLEAEIAEILISPVDPLEKDNLLKKIEQTKTDKATAEGLINTLLENVKTFKRTLANLGTNVCPISEKLVCTTDKTAAKAEFENLISQNENAVEKQREIVASYQLLLQELESKKTALVRQEELNVKKNNLELSLTRAKKMLGKPPVKPEPVASVDLSKKAALDEERIAIHKYSEYVKASKEYKELTEELAVLDSLTKKFAPKGIVTEKVIGFYCEIFTTETQPLADSVGYKIEFKPQKGLQLLITPGVGKRPVYFDNLSTGEQLIATVIVQHLCNTLSGCNVMLIDNFNDLDEANSKLLKTVINELATEYALLVVAGTNI